MVININETKSSLSKLLLWTVFILFTIFLSYTISYHELWADEMHSWNIAKGSKSFFDLISNTRYEGHPPVWYVIIWSISKFTHDVNYMQAAQLIIAGLAVFLVLFFSSFPIITRILLPFGYFFLFEYGVLSRNYAIGVLFALCICLILHKNFNGKLILYYCLLFLLSNTHLIALLLAFSLHFYFILLSIEQKKKTSTIFLHILFGALVLLPSLYFIFPPSDSQLNTDFWLSKLDIKVMVDLIQLPLRAFIPIPALWNYNFWNTQFLLELQSKYSIVKIITVSVLIVLAAMIFMVLKDNKKSLILFLTNLIVSLIVSVFFLLGAQRYVGFIFIGFVVSYWLYCIETPISRKNKRLVNILLFVQLIGGLFAVTQDIRFPFSNAYRVKELLKEIPPNKKIVTDYWALNTLTAFTDKPYYVLELHKEMSFLMWNAEFARMTQAQDLYSNGIKYLYQKEGIRQVYMISIHSPKNISNMDPQLVKLYKTTLIDKRDGAIEKGSNLYLYKISAL
jgi:hypothetical protein